MVSLPKSPDTGPRQSRAHRLASPQSIAPAHLDYTEAYRLLVAKDITLLRLAKALKKWLGCRGTRAEKHDQLSP
jgi:hypothetical protein